MVIDQINKGVLQVEYCLTGEMIVNYMTKGLQGIKFAKFIKVIRGFR